MKSELEANLHTRFTPLFDELAQRAAVADGIVDKDFYRILVATLWVNVVLDPAEAGVTDDHLETLHDVVNRQIAQVMGPEATLKCCFRYLNGKDGERAMKAARLTPEHRDMLLYFASMILDPEGHRRWIDEIRNQPSH